MFVPFENDERDYRVDINGVTHDVCGSCGGVVGHDCRCGIFEPCDCEASDEDISEIY